MKESKKRRRKQLGKLMAKSRSQPVNFPGARPSMNPPSKDVKKNPGPTQYNTDHHEVIIRPFMQNHSSRIQLTSYFL